MKKQANSERLTTIFESLSDISLVLVADFFAGPSAGGGFPVSLALAAAGVTVFPIGLVGEDESGQRILQSLHEHRVSTSGINRLKNYPTPEDLGGPEAIHDEHPALLNVIEHARKLAPAAEAFYVCDHAVGTASPRVLNFIKSNGCLTEKTVTARSTARIGEFEQLTTAIATESEMEGAIGIEIGGDAKKMAVAGIGIVGEMKLQAFLAVSDTKVFVFRGVHKPTTLTLDEGLSTASVDILGGFFAAALGAGAEPEDAAHLAAGLCGFFARRPAGAKRIRREELMATLSSRVS